jgi:uncharacterized repeat protein (TIGR01451 family)
MLALTVSLILAMLGIPAPVAARDVPFPSEHPVDQEFDGAESVYVADMDGDGDLDMLGAAIVADDIAWWENTAGDGGAWTEHPVDTDFDGARSVHAADVDGDGDLDVLGAAWKDDDIAWWKNNGPCTGPDGACTTWISYTVDIDFDGATSVHAADMDGDGDLDVLGAADEADDIAWWENTAGDGSSWTEHPVDEEFDGASDVYAADVDGDGDLDVLGAAFDADEIAWWENTAGDGSAWTEDTISASSGAQSVYAADLDGDGDLDVLGAEYWDDDIVWWENTAGDGSAWTMRTVESQFDGARSASAADVDGDGDLDVLGAASLADDITWWENTGPCTGPGGQCSNWPEHTVDADFDGAWAVHAADVDGDGDLDVLGAAGIADDIAWWENETIHRSATYPGAGEQTVDSPLYYARSVHAADVDGDGDLDVLGAWWGTGLEYGFIAWWENTAGDGGTWTRYEVEDFFSMSDSVYAGDVDGDGDLDILGAASDHDSIAWWENTAGDGSAWARDNVDSSFEGATSVHAADVDGDGDLDVLGAAKEANDVAWWENTAGDGSAWTQHSVTAAFTGTLSVYAADIDGDGDQDVLGAAEEVNDVAWWENTAGDGTAWTEHTVDANFGGAASAYAADIDGDGDLDVLGAASGADDISWWENEDLVGPGSGDGTTWTEHTVDGAFTGATSVHAADVDGDGDLDVLGASYTAYDIAWWENTAGDGGAWTEHTVDGAFAGANDVYSADVDGDGDLDVLSAGYPTIHWWENRGGQFALATSDTAPQAPPVMNPGTVDDVLAIEVTHRGRGGDGDLELVTLGLFFEGCSGDGCTPANLTSAQANELLDRLLVYRDDGSGVFELGIDTQVTTVAPLALTAGVQTVAFADGDLNVQVVQGTSRTYFVVVDRVDSAPATPTVDRFSITHLSEGSSTAEDRGHDIGLTLEYAANTTSSLIQTVCVPVSDVRVRRQPAGALFAGNTVHFSAEAAGSTPFSYEWGLDGLPVGSDQSTFERVFGTADSHTVEVTVDNLCGQGSDDMWFEILPEGSEYPDLSSSHKTVNLTTVESGDVLTYTLLLRNDSPTVALVTLVDPIPVNTTYISGSAHASDHKVVTHTGGQLHYSTHIRSGVPVVIEFAVEVQVPVVGTLVTNTAYVEDGFGHTAVLEATSAYNPGYRLTINDGALYTNAPTVTLRYSWNAADAISHVKFSNDGGLGPAGDTTDWLPVDAQDTLYEGWLLATYGDLRMPRIVYAVLRDAGGQQYGPLQDDIIYDPDAPTVTSVEVLEGTAVAAMSADAWQVTVRVTASDENSGLDEVRVSHNPDLEPYSAFPITGAVTDIPWTPQASGQVYVCVMDRAGNASETKSALASVQYRIFLPITVRATP